MIFCGIDIGNLTTKAVIMDGGSIVGSSLLSTSEEAELSAQQAAHEALKQAGLSWDTISDVVATGTGRKLVTFASQRKTSPTCLAKGINLFYPEVRTLVDIGAETSMVLRITSDGKVEESIGHDRCASGTGVFLETMARLLKMSMEEMAKASLQGQERAEISNMCTIFAEQEVISHIHRVPPTPLPDVIKGIHGSMAVRISGMAKRIGIKPEVAMSGGVARNIGFRRELEEELGASIIVPDDPELVAAVGAASLGRAGDKRTKN